VDFKYLEGFARGDRTVVRDVLQLFLGQAEIWSPHLSPDDDGWRDTVHTVKGSSRGIGATALGDACAQAEAVGPSGLVKVRAELQATTAAIRAYLAA
jgi:HPt (histidine-containing phosphotransfer) domain-containing protein